MAELFMRNVCVMHNFIINENGDEALLQEGATEMRTEDLANVSCYVALRLTTCVLDVRQKLSNYSLPLLGQFIGRIITCSRPLPCCHHTFTVITTSYIFSKICNIPHYYHS